MLFSRYLSMDFKMTTACAITGVVSLAVFTAAQVEVQPAADRELFNREMTAAGNALSEAVAPAVATSDRPAAKVVLSTAAGWLEIVRAAVLRHDGEEFLHYERPGAEKVADDELRTFLTPVKIAGKNIGTLRLEARYHNEMLALAWERRDVGIVVLLLSLAAGLLASGPLRNSLVRPVRRLSESIREMNERGNYSARAQGDGPHEVHELARRVNEVLDQMDMFVKRDEKQVIISRRQIQEMEQVTTARDSAEAALREVRQRYEVAAVAMLGSNEGLWDWDLTKNTMFFSPRWKSMLGFEDREVSNSFEAWMNLMFPEDRDRFHKHVEDYLAGRVPTFEIECRMRCKHGEGMWTHYRGAALRDSTGKAFRLAGAQTDISARKMAEAGMEQLHRQMVETSRFAGMAEVATGVLHNVGNVLNSVNVSATLVCDRLRGSKLPDLAAAAALFKEHAHDLPAFLAENPKGRVLTGYLRAGLEKIQADHGEMLKELNSLHRNIEHIKEVVSMQQTYARVSTPTETLTAAELIEEALRINDSASQASPVNIVRKFKSVPLVAADRHKAVQILINLLSNARHAMEKVTADRKQIELTIDTNERGAVTIAVRDNGQGISQENISRIFRHGFTTRKDGHGFGLHSSANAAKQMGGSLGVWSDGPGQGACFVLELPPAQQELEQKAA